MNKYFIHLWSQTPTVFMVEGKQVGAVFSPDESVDILISHQDTAMICVYPLECREEGACTLSYCAAIKFVAGTVVSDCEYITITDYGQGHFRIQAHEVYVKRKRENKLLQRKNLDGINITLSRGAETTLCAAKAESTLIHTIEYSLDTFDFDKFSGFVRLRATTSAGREYMLLVGSNSKEIYVELEIIADKIEVTDGKIIVLDNIKDIAQHGYVQCYEQKDNAFTLTEQYTVYTQEKAGRPAGEHAIPWAFMEALNIGNLNLAREYLEENLSGELDDLHLVNFFGNYEEVDFNRYQDRPNSLVVIYPGNPRTTKIFDFEIKNEKIYNISNND